MTIVHPGQKWLENTKYDTQTGTWPHLVYRTGAEYIRNTFNMYDSDLDDADLAHLKKQGIEP